MTSEATPADGPDPSDSPLSNVLIKVIRSEAIFEGQRLVYIEHAGSLYRLMITSRGKLILQK